MHVLEQVRAGQGWLDGVIREAIKRTLETVMEGEHEEFAYFVGLIQGLK